MNKTTQIIIGIIVIVIIVVLVIVFSGKKPLEGEIKIGAILPLTGNVAYWGQPVLKGMNFAVEEINSNGGINGKKLKLIIEDSKADPSEGVTALNKILTSDVMSVIVHTTAVSNAVAPILEENEVPFIANAADTGLPLKYKYAFKTFYNAYDECKKVVKYANSKGMKKYGLLLANMPWGDWCSKGVKEIVGESNTVDLRYAFKETDYRTLLLKAKEKKVDALVGVGWFAFESNAVNKQKAELGIDIPALCGYGHECVTDEILSEVPAEYLENYIIFDFIISDDFRGTYEGLSRAELIPAAFGYDEIHIITSTLRKCKEISRSCLYDNLPSVKDYPTALNSGGFDEMRNLIINTALYELKNKTFVRVK